MDKYINSKKAAQILDVSYSLLYQWRCNEKGPPYVSMEKIVRYKLKDLYDYKKKKEVKIK